MSYPVEQPKPKSQPKKSWAVHAQENKPLPPLTQISQDHNQNVNSKGVPSTPPVNREEIHKVAPPPIAHNVRAMFESGQIPDLHEIKKTTHIDIDQAPGSGVYENDPQQLEGVVRASDVNMSGETFERGKTKNIVNDWKYKGQYQPKAQVPINIAEDEGCVRENEPIIRDDVIKSGMPDNYEVELPKRGYAKGVLTKWGTRQEAPQKKEIRLIEGDVTEPIVAENQPMIRDDVVHSEDVNDDVQFEVGKIRNLTGYWATRTDDVNVEKKMDDIDVRVNQVRNQFLQQAQGSGGSKQPFVMDLAENGPSVVENEPSMLDENIVRSSTYVEEVVPGERGRIRNMTNRFSNPQDAPRQRRQIVIDRADGPCVVENEPIQLDDNIVRADMQSDIVSVDSGHTRSLMNKWKYFEADAATTKTSTSMSGKPAWILEMDAAPDSGVYENEPEERPELIREGDDNSEAGMELHTKEVKKLWSSIEHHHDDQRTKTPEVIRNRPGRKIAVLTARDAEVEEPEPVKQTGVPRRGVKYRGSKQEQAPPSEPEPAPVPQGRRRWGMGKTQPPEVKPEPSAVEVKPKGRQRWGVGKTQPAEVTPEVKPEPSPAEVKPRGRPRWGMGKTQPAEVKPEVTPEPSPAEVKPRGRPRWGGVKAMPAEVTPPVEVQPQTANGKPKWGESKVRGRDVKAKWEGGDIEQQPETNPKWGEGRTKMDEGPSLRGRPVSKWDGGKKKPPPVKPKPKAPETPEPEPVKATRRKPYRFKENWC